MPVLLRLMSLAIRNVARNRRRTAISLAALAIGVAACICLRGFIVGQQSLFLDGVVKGSLGALQVHKVGYLDSVESLPLKLDILDTPQLRARILAVPGVTALAPRIHFGAIISRPEDSAVAPSTLQALSSYLTATAIDPVLERAVVPKRFEWVGEGQLFDLADGQAIALGTELARGVGLVPSGSPLPEERRPALLAVDRDGSLNGEVVTVGATLVPADPSDRKVGLVPLVTAQRLLRMEGRVTEYALAVDRLEDAELIAARLAAELGPGFEVHSWSARLPFLRDIFHNMDLSFAVMMGVLLSIVLLGIVNATLLNVLERVREIGTMLAVGTRRAQIVQLFVIEGAALGLLGSALGTGLGALLVSLMHRVGIQIPLPGSPIPVLVRPEVPTPFLLLCLCGGALCSTLVTLWPATRASQLSPVEALAST